jgi:membrane protease subunit HflK
MTDDNFDPWSTPPKDKKKKPSAGSTPPPSGGNKKPEPDIEEALKNIGEQWKKLFGGSFDGGNSGGNKIKWGKVLAIVGGLWLISSSVFMLSSGEKAVILRFGEYYRTVGEGLNFKFPYPIEKKFVRSVTKVNQFEIGANEENLMVTSDENIADVKYTVLWLSLIHI